MKPDQPGALGDQADPASAWLRRRGAHAVVISAAPAGRTSSTVGTAAPRQHRRRPRARSARRAPPARGRRRWLRARSRPSPGRRAGPSPSADRAARLRRPCAVPSSPTPPPPPDPTHSTRIAGVVHNLPCTTPSRLDHRVRGARTQRPPGNPGDQPARTCPVRTGHRQRRGVATWPVSRSCPPTGRASTPTGRSSARTPWPYCVPKLAAPRTTRTRPTSSVNSSPAAGTVPHLVGHTRRTAACRHPSVRP